MATGVTRRGPPETTRWLRLAPVFDVALLQADLATALAWHWRAHDNTGAYDGRWTSIALRSASGRADDIDAHEDADFTDTPLLAHCPTFGALLAGFACVVKSARLMALDAGAVIKPHRDLGGAFEDGLARLHIPIVTDPRVLFTLDGEDVHFSAGATWYMNANCLHAVRNGSARTRVHLVLDCVPDPWLLALFEAAGFAPRPAPKYGDPSIDDANVGLVVAQLRAAGTAEALALADKLEVIQKQ